jgi:lysophospholipase L1-like esterase
MQPDGFWASRVPIAEASARYGAAIAYFAATLDDLTHTVVSLMGGPQDFIYIHHPRLENPRPKGYVFNNIVSDTIREVATRGHVRYYDATDDLKTEFGATPERYYIANDMHFNERGLQAYSLAVAKFLATAVPGDKPD